MRTLALAPMFAPMFAPMLLAACAAPRAESEKMSFAEAFGPAEPAHKPVELKAAPPAAGVSLASARAAPAPSAELQSQLLRFASRARSLRAQATQGAPMPPSQA